MNRISIRILYSILGNNMIIGEKYENFRLYSHLPSVVGVRIEMMLRRDLNIVIWQMPRRVSFENCHFQKDYLSFASRKR